MSAIRDSAGRYHMWSRSVSFVTFVDMHNIHVTLRADEACSLVPKYKWKIPEEQVAC